MRARRAPLDDDGRRRMWAQREARRITLIAQAAREALAAGELSHESVAGRSGIPLGYLRWAFPSTDELLHAAGPVSLP